MVCHNNRDHFGLFECLLIVFSKPMFVTEVLNLHSALFIAHTKKDQCKTSEFTPKPLYTAFPAGPFCIFDAVNRHAKVHNLTNDVEQHNQDDENEYTDWKQYHRARVKLPTRPLVNIYSPPGREKFITLLVNISYLLCI